MLIYTNCSYLSELLTYLPESIRFQEHQSLNNKPFVGQGKLQWIGFYILQLPKNFMGLMITLLLSIRLKHSAFHKYLNILLSSPSLFRFIVASISFISFSNIKVLIVCSGEPFFMLEAGQVGYSSIIYRVPKKKWDEQIRLVLLNPHEDNFWLHKIELIAVILSIIDFLSSKGCPRY